MRKIILGILLGLVLVSSFCFAEDSGITLKQGLIYPFKENSLQNITTLTIANTKAIDGLGKWNVFIDGWVVDAGFAYNSTNILNDGALLLGRKFETFGDYLPIDFPLKDKIEITIYPIGLYIRDVFSDDIKMQGCAGIAYISASIKF